MASKVMLDANILLDLLLKREAYDQARNIIELVVSGRIQAFITPAIVHITGYWLTKAYGSAKSKKLLLTILTNVQVIDLSHIGTLTALHSSMTDIEDSLQYYTAIEHHLDIFISRDNQLQKMALPSLPVYTPAEFLNEF